MKAARRQARILQLIGANPGIRLGAIATRLSTPIETIRGDLNGLENEGVIRRERGRSEIVRPDVVQARVESSGALSRSERHQRILRLIAAGGEKRVTTLAARLGVSVATMRADLAYLESTAQIDRTHGGVRAAPAHGGDLVAHLVREEAAPGLASICRRAASHIETGDVVFLDGSPAAVCIALELPVDRGATVITNNLRAAAVLTERGYTEDVFVAPGKLIPHELVTDMRYAAPMTSRFRITKAFLGAQSYDAKRGLLFDSEVHLDIFTSMSETADGFYVLLESRTLGETGVYGAPLYPSLPRLREVIIDDGLDVDRVGALVPPEYPVVVCGDNYVLKSPFHRQYIIGFASLFGGYEFSRLVRQSIEEAARGYSNVELLLTDNMMDPDVTMRNVNTFIEKKVDLVIEYQHDYTLGPLIMEKLSHARIPVIAVDIPIPGAVYFGVNNYSAGYMAGEEAARAVRERWQGKVDVVIALTAPASGPTPGNRVVGMLEALRASVEIPEDRVLRVSTANTPEASAQALGQVLPSITAGRRMLVLAFNDVVCSGVLEALRRHGRGEHAMVVSHSHVPSISRELAQEGSPLIGSVAYHPEGYGMRILELAVRMLRGENVGPNNYTEHQWLTT